MKDNTTTVYNIDISLYLNIAINTTIGKMERMEQSVYDADRHAEILCRDHDRIEALVNKGVYPQIYADVAERNAEDAVYKWEELAYRYDELAQHLEMLESAAA